MISYSQNGEDVVLRRVLCDVKIGSYIDIGAGHPVEDSVTKHFYDQGWSGTNIEPDQRHFSHLILDRLRDRNLKLCVSTEKGEAEFWITKVLGWSTSNVEIQKILSPDDVLQVEKVDTILLDEILDMTSSPVHFLKIDCEGGEKEIIEASAMKKNRPWIIVVESISPRSNKWLGSELNRCLELKDYEFKLFDGINNYYVDRNKPDLISSDKWYPACILDNYKKYTDIQDFKFFERETYQAVIQKEAALKDLRAIVIQKEAALKDLRAIKSKYRQTTIDFHQKVTNLIEKLRISTAIADSMQAELNSIRDSNIWKSTSKYRKLKNRLKQTFSKCLEFWKKEENLYTFVKKLFRFAISQTKFFLFFIFQILNLFKGKIGKKSELRKSIDSIPAYRQVSSFGNPTTIVSSLFKKDPFVLVGSTARVATNSGVQRVARSFVNSLIKQGFSPVLVKVDIAKKSLEVLSEDEYKAFMESIRSNVIDAFLNSHKFSGAVENGILLVPEVPYLGQVDPLVCEVLLAYCNSNYLTAAAIYFDSIPLTRAEYGMSRTAHEAYLRFLSSCILVSSISKHSENELKELLSVGDFNVSPQNPIFVTKHLPLPSQLIETESEAIQKLLGRKFVLAVGTVEPRKNQGNLIKAFENVYPIHENNPILVIVGNVRDDVRNWKREANPSQVIWLIGLKDNNLRWLYENCLYSVFLSLAEGFGYPILESQYFKKICVTSNFGSMQEVAAKGGCILVDNPTELSEIQAALIQADKTSIDNLQKLDFEDWDEYTSEFHSRARSLIRERAKEFRILYWVDHTVTFEANTGIQRVVRGIAKTLLNAGFELVPVKWNSLDSKFEIPNEEELRHLQDWNGPESFKFSLELGENSKKLDFLVITELTTYSHDDHLLGKVINFAKNMKIPVATVFYDALPVKLSQIYSSATSQRHTKYMEDLINSDLIFTISKSVQNDLSDFILEQDIHSQTALARIVRLDLPASIGQDRFAKINSIETEKPAIGKTKILCVGTLEPRKNHIRLLESFSKSLEQCKIQNVELILVGRSADEDIARKVKKFGETLPIVWKTGVSDSELMKLYETCAFTVFPSLAEGFGLPILESLSFGKPVICGFGSALDQVSDQGGCLQVDVSNVDKLAEAITVLLTNQEVFEELELQAINRPFTSWEEYGSNFIKVLLNFNRRGSGL